MSPPRSLCGRSTFDAGSVSAARLRPGDRSLKAAMPKRLVAVAALACALCISCGASAQQRYTVESGDTLGAIAIETGCTVGELRAANGISGDAIRVGQRLSIPSCTPAETGNTYTVVSGDILGRIAENIGCSVSAIQAANNMSDDIIRVGQRLRIPADCSATGGASASSATPQPTRSGSGSGVASEDGGDLQPLMQRYGFNPPEHFRALVMEFTFDRTRSNVIRERIFDYDNTGSRSSGWNPASTVKLFAGIAALRRIRELGFTPDAQVTFHTSPSAHTYELRELVQDALGPSNNIAYNLLVTFVGWDYINGEFLTPSNGFRGTAMRRAYERTRWTEMGFQDSFRPSPEITITEGGRSRTIEARNGDHEISCHGAACTSLRDLAEALRRLMLQEQLPAGQHWSIPTDDLRMIRRTLRTDRRRGEEVVDALGEHISGDGVRFYHKAGYSADWYSDNVYVYDPTEDQAWIVSLAGYPGRDCLTEAAGIIGQIIASGELRRQ